jgi:hypothetical protein
VLRYTSAMGHSGVASLEDCTAGESPNRTWHQDLRCRSFGESLDVEQLAAGHHEVAQREKRR